MEGYNGEDRRKKPTQDRRKHISPAIAEFALDERPSLMVKIEQQAARIAELELEQQRLQEALELLLDGQRCRITVLQGGIGSGPLPTDKARAALADSKNALLATPPRDAELEFAKNERQSLMVRIEQLTARVIELEASNVPVPRGALRAVLAALIGNPHEIRELQATRTPEELFKDNPINVLLKYYQDTKGTGQ